MREHDLPPKVLVVHQFRRAMVRGRGKISRAAASRCVLNFDGIGGPRRRLPALRRSRAAPFNGFSLFYRRDTPLMKPGSV